MENNLVYNPKHYNHPGRKECWEEMREIFGDEAVAIFDVLSAYKYLYRAGTKDGNPEEQDLAKIENYIRHAKSLIEDLHPMNASLPISTMIRFKKVEKFGFNPYQE